VNARSVNSSYQSAPPTPLEYFASLIAEDDNIPLLEAAATIAQDEYPSLDVQGVLNDVDVLCQRLRRRLPADLAPLQRLRALHHFFFEELGFAGNVNDYYDPTNSFLDCVLFSRRGIPITLAVIFMEIAHEIGLVALGLSFPGHFLVKVRLPGGDVIIDPFSGQSLGREQLLARATAMEAGLSAPEGESGLLRQLLQAAASRDILVRMLRNLKHIYLGASDWRRALAVQHRLVLLLPTSAQERHDRGLAHAHLGDLDAAREDWEYYLRETSGIEDAQRIQSGVAALFASANLDGRATPRQNADGDEP